MTNYKECYDEPKNMCGSQPLTPKDMTLSLQIDNLTAILGGIDASARNLEGKILGTGNTQTALETGVSIPARICNLIEYSSSIRELLDRIDSKI